jgi:hypothetical protein
MRTFVYDGAIAVAGACAALVIALTGELSGWFHWFVVGAIGLAAVGVACLAARRAVSPATSGISVAHWIHAGGRVLIEGIRIVSDRSQPDIRVGTDVRSDEGVTIRNVDVNTTRGDDRPPDTQQSKR